MNSKINLSAFGEYKHVEENHIYDLLIIGGGPAALNAVLYAYRKKLDVALITEDIGGQIVQSSFIENWLGIPKIDTTELINNFFTHIYKFNIPMKKDVKVLSMNLDQEIKQVMCTDNQRYQAKTIIIATGKKNRCLEIPGEENFVGRGVAYCNTYDASSFKNKKVVVVGGGNSGVYASLELINFAREVILVQNLSVLTVDPLLLDKISKEPRINVVYDHVGVRIEGSECVNKFIICNTKTNVEQVILTDAVFVEIGLVPASSFVPDFMKNDQGEIIIDNVCHTVVPGVFAAGDVSNTPFKQVIIAAAEGAKAVLGVYNYFMNNSVK